jgi:putative oxidoreductase
MNQLTSVGKFLFLVPFFFFGVSHLMGAGDMKGMVPAFLPGGVLWVYLTGLGMLGFVVAMMIGKYDKLAAVLLAIMLIIFAVAIHLPQQSSNPMWMIGFLKDLGLAGGALMIADKYARDNSIIG